MSDLKLYNINKKFGSVEVLPKINLTVPQGSFTVLVGPSGCGKSTLLRLIAGLEPVSGGEILIDGQDVTHAEPIDRGIAMVFQSYALYPHMTVEENIGFGLKLQRQDPSRIRKAVQGAAETLKLEAYLKRKPAALSGGQRQRVAIGRAIVRKPKLFLFDEPLSNLDAAHRAEMRVELWELHERLGSTSIYVTHDQVEAMTMADQIVVMNAGRIEQIGTPRDIYFRPATPFVASFIGNPKINFFDGDIARAEGCDQIGVRPESIALSRDTGDWAARIAHIENLGSEQLIYTDGDQTGRCVVKISTGGADLSDWSEGDAVFLNPDRSALHRFSAGARL